MKGLQYFRKKGARKMPGRRDNTGDGCTDGQRKTEVRRTLRQVGRQTGAGSAGRKGSYGKVFTAV